MTGTLRIRYKHAKRVFEYPRMRREDCEEMIARHAHHWRYETVLENGEWVKREVDWRETIIAEWVENPGSQNEKVTPIALPKPPKQ